MHTHTHTHTFTHPKERTHLQFSLLLIHSSQTVDIEHINLSQIDYAISTRLYTPCLLRFFYLHQGQYNFKDISEIECSE